MGDKLLIRAFDVEVGDCIYVRIPNATITGADAADFHMLIDCGTKGAASIVESAVQQLEALLPLRDGGRRWLDLLVVTHEHEDHIKGFDPASFANIDIGNIWMSAAMDPDHPQSTETHELRALATDSMRAVADSGLPLDPEFGALVSLYGINNDGAMDALQNRLPEQNGIDPTYVHAGMSSESLELPLDDAVIHVLGPEQDIDRFYLGVENVLGLHSLQAANAEIVSANGTTVLAAPKNIGLGDFRLLQSRMLSSAFAFAELSSKVTNNTSVVLLIEWRGRRLLFVGDAEWEGEYREGKHNGSWNVMWHERRGMLDASVDFLKIGHHGSTNSTPWNDLEDGSSTEAAEILDAILPLPTDGSVPTAQALVSTKRKNYKTIPMSALLVELGRRVSNTRNYELEFEGAGFEPTDLPEYEDYEREWLARPQPHRTDHERLLNAVGFVDVEIGPND